MRYLVAAGLTDCLCSQPCCADGVCLGERAATPFAVAIVGEGQGEGQHEGQQGEYAADQEADALAFAWVLTSRGVPAPGQEADLVGCDLGEEEDRAEGVHAPGGNSGQDHHRRFLRCHAARIYLGGQALLIAA